MSLGLETSELIDDWWSQNTRRKIFYSYPNGTAPLAGLLSLTDTDETPFPEFGWDEMRWEQLRTTTLAGHTANAVFYNTGTTVSSGTTVTPTAGTVYRIYVTNSTTFQQDDVFKIHRLPLSSGSTEVGFRVNSTDSSDANYNFVEAECIATASGAIVNNAASVVGLQVVYSGSAFAEGSRSRTGRVRFPSVIYNETQIFKTAFEMTSTALKAPTKYDKTGDYKNQLKQNGIDHLSGLEWSLFFGDKQKTTKIDADTGAVVRLSYMGGLLWYLKQWEKGSVSNGGAWDYRNNAVDVSGQTDWTTYPDKRIIRLAGASVTKEQFDSIEALPFRKTNSTEWCKLCLCGPGYIAKINARFEKSVTKSELRGDQYDGWDFKVTHRDSLQGEVYYKQHPLFSNTEMDSSAFYIDLGYLKYRPLTDRDTDIQQMIQLPDADKRKDQWLTEAGFEILYPEAHLFVDQIGSITL